MKRNCNECRALSINPSGLGNICSLGYKMECTEVVYGELPVSYKPLEECPKPMTFMKFCKTKRKGC